MINLKIEMAEQDTDLQESMCPESRADFDYCTLPTIQSPNNTRDPQTGDISAILQRNKVRERHSTPVNHQLTFGSSLERTNRTSQTFGHTFQLTSM